MNAAEWIAARSGLALRPWQRAVALAIFPPDGSPSPYETFLISTIKKSGKSTLSAWLTLYAALRFPAPETAYMLGNDLSQAEENSFELVAAAVKDAGLEASGAARVLSDRIEFESGTRIIALPSDYAGVAGARFGITCWTEAWAFRHESHIRLYEELTPIPNRRSLRIIDSSAGFSGDAPVLEPLWQRAVAGERIDLDLPIYTDGKLWAYLDTGEEAQHRCFLGDPAERDEYYAEQRRSLRPGTFDRLHLNKWASGEEAFVTAPQWDACTTAEPPAPDPGAPVHLGLDAATKRDCAAVVGVAWSGDRLVVVDHRIWTPTAREPIDLEDIESYVLGLTERFPIAAVRFDPYQFIRSAKAIRAGGVRVEEFAQTSANLTAAGTALYDAIGERRLIAPEEKQLRSHVLNAVAIDSGRGWRLAKEKASRKIDAAVALSFAVLAATEAGGGVTPAWVDDPDAEGAAWEDDLRLGAVGSGGDHDQGLTFGLLDPGSKRSDW